MYLSSTEQAQSAFLGVINLKGKMETEIMDVILKFFRAKSLRIKKMWLSFLDTGNNISGKKNDLQRKIKYNSPSNILKIAKSQTTKNWKNRQFSNSKEQTFLGHVYLNLKLGDQKNLDLSLFSLLLYAALTTNHHNLKSESFDWQGNLFSSFN